MKDKALIELIVVVALVGFGLWSMKDNIVPVSNNGETIINETIESGNTNPTDPVVPLSYAQALVKYKDARIQLDNTCRANPDRMVFKNNTNIMIDNRASVARTVKVGSTFNMPAYSFKIVKLSSATIPATWYVDCGSSQNVSTILIQK